MEQGRTMNKGSGRNGSGEVQDRAAERSICLVSCRAPTSLDVNTREQCITLEYRVLSCTQITPLFLYQYLTSPIVAAGRAWRPRIPLKAMRLSAILPHDP